MFPDTAHLIRRFLVFAGEFPLFIIVGVLFLQTLAQRAAENFQQFQRDELKRDFDEFVESYRRSRAWWASSLLGSIFAAISSIAGLTFAGLAFVTFAVPPLGYYYLYRPFGLRCNYIPLGDDRDEDPHACRPIEGTYTIQLEVKPGQAIEDYRLDVHTPSGAALDRIDGNTSHHDDDRSIVYGVVQKNPESYTEALYVEKTGSISPDGELVLIKSQGKDQTMEWIRLLPPK